MKKLLVLAVVAASFASCAGGAEKKVEGDTAAVVAAPAVDTAVKAVDTAAKVAVDTAKPAAPAAKK